MGRREIERAGELKRSVQPTLSRIAPGYRYNQCMASCRSSIRVDERTLLIVYVNTEVSPARGKPCDSHWIV